MITTAVERVDSGRRRVDEAVDALAQRPEITSELTHARLLLVDDEVDNLARLRRLLRGDGYQAIADTTDPGRAVALYREFQPDLVCLDLNMPGLSGFDVLQQLAGVIPRDTYLPILMLTGDSTPGTLQRALALGAKDFVRKPFGIEEVRLRIRNLLEPRFMHLRLLAQNESLESRVRERTSALEASRVEIIERLARAADFRDDDTGQHTRRVARSSQLLALEMGLSEAEAELIARAALLHDIGKIGISDGILLKPGRLSEQDFALMKQHATIGADILADGRTSLVRMAATIALHHHERWDGSGYPAALAGLAIPVAARVVALADVFDALTHRRPYREAWPLERVLSEIVAQRARHFDPDAVDAFLRLPHSDLI